LNSAELDDSEIYLEDDVDDSGSESELSDSDFDEQDEAELYDMFSGNGRDMEITSYD
jgi:hypothetical protein